MKEVKKWIIFSTICLTIYSTSYGQSSPLYQYFRPQMIQLDTTKRLIKPLPILKNYMLDSQPIFCKWEELWTRSTNINVRLRLGSLQYVDELEKK